LKLSSEGGDSGTKKCERCFGGAYGGFWPSLESGGLFFFVLLTGTCFYPPLLWFISTTECGARGTEELVSAKLMLQ
jgi:hypothetical protein